MKASAKPRVLFFPSLKILFYLPQHVNIFKFCTGHLMVYKGLKCFRNYIVLLRGSPSELSSEDVEYV